MDKNFSGLLPIFDFLFQTAYFPNRKPAGFGLVEERAPSTFWRQILWPFKSEA